MHDSKIQLSSAELALVCDADIILTKNTIIKKAIGLLEIVQDQVVPERPDAADVPLLSVPPKISKGENYLGLPYVVLDFPRVHQAGEMAFIRSMFWWGHFFSSTLHLSGRYKELSGGRLKHSHAVLAQHGYSIGIHDDPWQHHFGADNYREISQLSANAYALILDQQAHIKIAARWTLDEWDKAAAKLYQSWKLLYSVIKGSL